MSGFEYIEDWVFDLDNTLYPSSSRLFEQIDQRMTAYLADYLKLPPDAARKVQKDYFRDYGTTMNGMMVEHGMEPDPYLSFVHDIDHTLIAPAPELLRGLKALPGRKLVFTNGSQNHAEKVLARLGIAEQFADIHDIKASDYVPKPARETYEMMIARLKVAPPRAAMFEDIARNLTIPFEMGMTTVFVKNSGPHADACAINLGTGDEDHVHFATDDLAAFLGGLNFS